MIEIQQPQAGQAALTEPILRALPAWFGIEDATRHYIEFTDRNPTFIAFDGSHAVGFLALLVHSPHAAEIYVMAVLPEYHRKGIGRALVEAAELYLRGHGFEYLQVKTLAETHPDEGYRVTRTFYRSAGFRHLEVFPELWGANNPCLQMIKRL